MKKVGVICLIAIILYASADAGKTFTTESGKRYYVEGELKFTWSEAIDRCRQMNMTLISIDSQKKDEEVTFLIQTNFNEQTGFLWTGGHDHNVSRHFEWISTGEAFAYTNWRSGEPYGAYHCVAMIMDASFGWGIYDCTNTHGFVCEETLLQKTNADIIFLKESLDNQTNLLKEKTEELDSLRKEFEKFKNKQDMYTNLKLEFDERNTLIGQRLEEMQKKQEEFLKFQKSSDQRMSELNQTKNDSNKAQVSSENEIKPMLKDIQTTLQRNQNQINDAFTKIGEINQSGAIKSIGNLDISNPTYCAAKSAELEALKKINEILMKELFDVLQKSYERNTNRTTPNNIFPSFNKN